MNVAALIVAFIIVSVIGLTLGALFAWVAVELVAGYDISLREALGIGLLINYAGSGAHFSR